MAANHVPLKNYGKSAVYEMDPSNIAKHLLLNRASSRAGANLDQVRGGKVFPPAQEFGKRRYVSRILMPTAPTRIKLSPALKFRAATLWH